MERRDFHSRDPHGQTSGTTRRPRYPAADAVERLSRRDGRRFKGDVGLLEKYPVDRKPGAAAGAAGERAGEIKITPSPSAAPDTRRRATCRTRRASKLSR